MCQQWFSVIGLALDVIGVLFIAYEWGSTSFEQFERRMYDLHYDRERHKAEMSELHFNDPRARAYQQWRDIAEAEWQELTWRGWVFGIGLVLVILGFLGQLLGSLPPGIPYFPFRPC